MITSQMLQKSECKRICSAWKAQVRKKIVQDAATVGVLAHLCLCGTLPSSTHTSSTTSTPSVALTANTSVLNMDER